MHNIEHGILIESAAKRFPIEWYFTGGVLTDMALLGTHGSEEYARLAGIDGLNQLNGDGRGMLIFPNFVPDGAFQGTRENAQGLDVNRHAYRQSHAYEAAALMRYMEEVAQLHEMQTGKPLRLKTIMTIHGDGEFDASYLYINGRLPMQWRIDKFREDANKLGLPLHDGLDVPRDVDPTLGNYIDNGFVLQSDGEGSIETYLTRFADTVMCVEMSHLWTHDMRVLFFHKVREHFVMLRYAA